MQHTTKKNAASALEVGEKNSFFLSEFNYNYLPFLVVPCCERQEAATINLILVSDACHAQHLDGFNTHWQLIKIKKKQDERK